MTTPRQNPIITLTGVKKSFGSVAALRGIDMVVNEGEFFSILGPSGCGKTTLLRLISGFDHPTSGSIEIDGKPADELVRKIAALESVTQAIPMTF